jgi:hypothetical protein
MGRLPSLRHLITVTKNGPYRGARLQVERRQSYEEPHERGTVLLAFEAGRKE